MVLMVGKAKPNQAICQQSGAAGACWAHNPEVDGSKPSSASSVFLFLLGRFLFYISSVNVTTVIILFSPSKMQPLKAVFAISE